MYYFFRFTSISIFLFPSSVSLSLCENVTLQIENGNTDSNFPLSLTSHNVTVRLSTTPMALIYHLLYSHTTYL